MKKFIGTIIVVIVLAILAAFGVNFFKGAGPRERVRTEKGDKVIVEELSWYNHNDKLFGKVYKPADEKGNYPDSLGPRPVAIFLHEPLKTTYGEGVIKSLVGDGVIGYMSDCPEKSKNIDVIVKKISKESFTSEGMIFIIADRYSADKAVESVTRIGQKIAGLTLIDPALQGKSAVTAKKFSNEILTVDAEHKGQAVSQIEDYMELRGAFK